MPKSKAYGGTLATKTKADANKKTSELKKLGYVRIRITKVDPGTMVYRKGYRYWVDYDIPKRGPMSFGGK